MRSGKIWMLSLVAFLIAEWGAAEKVKMAASIYPLYDWVQQLGGERVEARCIVPPGSSPHFYAPTPAEVRWLSEGKLFFLIGRGMEEWAEKLVRSLGEKKIKRVRLGERLLALDSKGRELTNERGADPHVWLDPQLAMEMCRRIAGELIKVDPAGKNLYEKNLERYLKELEKLDRELQRMIGQLPNREYVGLHSAFIYFARRYGLRQQGLIEASPGQKAQAKQWRELVEQLRSMNAAVVFAEYQMSDKQARLIAREAGAKVVRLDPLGDPVDPQRSSYVKCMRFNMETIKRNLGAQP